MSIDKVTMDISNAIDIGMKLAAQSNPNTRDFFKNLIDQAYNAGKEAGREEAEKEQADKCEYCDEWQSGYDKAAMTE